LPCFGSGFSLCLFTGVSTLEGYFFAPPPFCGAGSVYCQPPLLSVCYDSSLFFSFVGQFGFSLAQEKSSVIPYLPCFQEWLMPSHSPPSRLSSVCLLIIHTEVSSLPLPLSVFLPPLLCARLQLASCYSVFWGGVSLPRDCAGLSWGWLPVWPGAHLFQMSSRQFWSWWRWAAVAVAAPACWLCSRLQLLGVIKG
jgi:hypothetical protein